MGLGKSQSQPMMLCSNWHLLLNRPSSGRLYSSPSNPSLGGKDRQPSALYSARAHLEPQNRMHHQTKTRQVYLKSGGKNTWKINQEFLERCVSACQCAICVWVRIHPWIRRTGKGDLRGQAGGRSAGKSSTELQSPSSTTTPLRECIFPVKPSISAGNCPLCVCVCVCTCPSISPVSSFKCYIYIQYSRSI